jgi:hypothetical protein
MLSTPRFIHRFLYIVYYLVSTTLDSGPASTSASKCRLYADEDKMLWQRHKQRQHLRIVRRTQSSHLQTGRIIWSAYVSLRKVFSRWFRTGSQPFTAEKPSVPPIQQSAILFHSYWQQQSLQPGFVPLVISFRISG